MREQDINYRDGKVAWVDEIQEGQSSWYRISVQSIFGDLILRRMPERGFVFTAVCLSSRVVAGTCFRKYVYHFWLIKTFAKTYCP